KWKSVPEDTATADPPRHPPTFTVTIASADIRIALETVTEECIGRQVAAVDHQYKAFCQDPDSISDYLTVRYALRNHHHTLYYYDRAGNLTKTVSPEGVNRLIVKPQTRDDTTGYIFATTYDY